VTWADLLGVLAGDFDLARLGRLVHRDAQGQHAGGVVGVDVLGVEGVAEEHLPGQGAGRAPGGQQFHVAVGAGPLRVDDRLHQIMALTSDGLTLAGIPKVLERQG
jgi:hypothetical protein